ncbi:MAG TPA: hypothetical protein VFT66_15360, partial [Roseiflexaceae bacterium]|nr:hypothetical protein [Roseiflexaceae bacterium]
MFRQQRAWVALLAFAAVALLLSSTGATGASASQAPGSLPGGAASVPAAAPCNLITPFNASNFSNPTNINSTWFPLVPGTEFIWEGRVNQGGQRVDHQVILIVTDLTKMIQGVRTVVLWDRDYNTGILTESELTFHAQDDAQNIWNLGEYPAQYSGGMFTGAPDTWISGLKSAQGGTVIPGDPKTGTAKFLQAYAPNIIGDCGKVASVGQQNPALCVPVGCYDNVLVIDEDSPPEPGTQQKYYAPGAGSFKVGATDNDPQGETLVLSETVRLSRDECLTARQEVLALEAQANQVSPKVYGQTAPMEQTGFCETIQPAETPTTAPTTPPATSPTATQPPSPTGTPPTPTAQAAPNLSIYIPIADKNLPTPPALPTPTVPPAIYDGCKSNPNPAGATNSPVRIVKVDKVKEIVTLQNVS